MSYNVNDRVRLLQDIIEPPSDYAPATRCGKAGDIVIVREVRDGGKWPYSVSHEWRTDGNTFSVGPQEIEPEQKGAQHG